MQKPKENGNFAMEENCAGTRTYLPSRTLRSTYSDLRINFTEECYVINNFYLFGEIVLQVDYTCAQIKHPALLFIYI